MGGLATKGTAVGVVARGPAGAVGTLVNRALVPIVPKMMAGMTGLVVSWMSGWEGNLRVTSSPPGLYSLEDTFLVRHQGGRGRRDIRGRGASG